MTFRLGQIDYGIELTKIREILIYPANITPLPNTEKWIKGLINLRGEVVPVLDLRVRFHTSNDIKYDENTAVIAIITDDKRMIGLVVDKVDDVKHVDLSNMVAVSDIGSAIPSKYLKGLLRNSDNTMLVLMNIESVVSKEELKA
jgi:purine-binding chemotaxis protein CheW